MMPSGTRPRLARPEAGPSAKKSNVSGDALIQRQTKWVQFLFSKADEMLKPTDKQRGVTHPAAWALRMYGPTNAGGLNRRQLREAVQDVLGCHLLACDESGAQFPEIGHEFTAELPLDAYVLHRVSVADVVDLPKTSQWTNWFEDILCENFDADREPLRGFSHDSHGQDAAQPVSPGSVDLQRGFTRVSILFFASHWATRFFSERPEMFQSSQEELESLKKCPAAINNCLGLRCRQKCVVSESPEICCLSIARLLWPSE